MTRIEFTNQNKQMSTPGKSGDALVDDFVRYANEAGFEWRFPYEAIPAELKTEETDGAICWKIQAAASNPWAEELAQKLPHALPDIYRSLIHRYRFCNFEVGSIMFFANSGHELTYELSTKSFEDPGLYPTLHRNGYLQFANPFEGNYDPICFDTRRQKRGDAPIVQLDHEEILIRERISVVQEIAPSLAGFMRRAIAEKLPVR